MLEREIEKYFVKRVADVGGIAYKFTSPSNRGVYDRIVLMPNGVTWFVELKSPKGKLSKLQERFRDRLIMLGHRNAVIASNDAVDNFVKILKGETH
tara:strand:- start:730 stop:1017 length:288 start_codon:yes stop_codon:yes gene_type:complete